jgi:Kef-type K+ transport system membrane component KefB/nucleotide-binding universal stress UspA family protein
VPAWRLTMLDQSGAILILQVTLLVVVGRALGEVLRRAGQPAVIGALLSGLLLGPSFFGWLAPQWFHIVFPDSPNTKNQLEGIAEIGVVMLLLLTGMEVDLRLVRKVGAPAAAVAVSGVLVPFVFGFGLGELMPDSLLPDPARRTVAALFLSTALAISSIKIVAVTVTEMNFLRRDVGQILVASAILEDTAGWIIVSLVLGFAASGGLSLRAVTWTLAGTIGFLALSYTLGRPLVFRLIRLVNDHSESDFMVVTAVLAIMLVLVLITWSIGVNMVLGAFTAGVLVGESPILVGRIRDQLQGFVTAFLAPIFFGVSGLGADLTILRNPTLLLLTGALVLIGSVGKFTGAAIGAVLSRRHWRDAIALGCAMNARGSTEVIVASIGLSSGVLSRDIYTMIVAMAVLTTMAMPPTLKRALARLPLGPEEAERLRKEAIDAGGLVSRFERVLVAADGSPNGSYATTLAGFLAGQRELPVTVLSLAPGDLTSQQDAARLAAEAKQSAHVSATVTEAGKERGGRGRVEVITRAGSDTGAAIVAAESKKGFDLLFIGLAAMHDERTGEFTERVNQLAAEFDGPIALAIAAEGHHAHNARHARMLIPVSGTESSRRGAELAFAIVSPARTRCVAVHVVEQTPAVGSAVNTVEAVRDDIAALGERHGFHVTTQTRHDTVPADAIMRTAASIRADLLVIGAERRLGDGLSLGKTVSALVRNWRGDMVILANQRMTA